MQGIVSFHPVDLEFFDRIVEPLVAGEKINPERFLDTSQGVRTAAWEAHRYKLALERQFELLQPPPPPAEGTLWQKVRIRLERFDFKPDPLAALVSRKIETDLHLHGRPFLITEGSAERVVTLVDEYLQTSGEEAARSLVLEQLIRLDPELAKQIEPEDPGNFSAEMIHRRELLGSLKILFDLPQAAREGGDWGRLGGDREPAGELLPRMLPWLAVHLHSRAVPFWVGRDVDGLETVCRAAEVEPPGCLVPPLRLFSRSCQDFPSLRETFDCELKQPRQVGAFVTPDEVPDLLGFLNTAGSRIIQVATQHGEGNACASLLRKIRECAQYAERHGMGYLEASGIRPVEESPEEDG